MLCSVIQREAQIKPRKVLVYFDLVSTLHPAQYARLATKQQELICLF